MTQHRFAKLWNFCHHKQEPNKPVFFTNHLVLGILLHQQKNRLQQYLLNGYIRVGNWPWGWQEGVCASQCPSPGLTCVWVSDWKLCVPNVAVLSEVCKGMQTSVWAGWLLFCFLRKDLLIKPVMTLNSPQSSCLRCSNDEHGPTLPACAVFFTVLSHVGSVLRVGQDHWDIHHTGIIHNNTVIYRNSLTNPFIVCYWGMSVLWAITVVHNAQQIPASRDL